MQLINVELIPPTERQAGDGKCRITIRYADGSEQKLYARELPGNDAAGDCLLATLIEAGERISEDTKRTTSTGSVMVQFQPHEGRVPLVTFYPR